MGDHLGTTYDGTNPKTCVYHDPESLSAWEWPIKFTFELALYLLSAPAYM